MKLGCRHVNALSAHVCTGQRYFLEREKHPSLTSLYKSIVYFCNSTRPTEKCPFWWSADCSSSISETSLSQLLCISYQWFKLIDLIVVNQDVQYLNQASHYQVWNCKQATPAIAIQSHIESYYLSCCQLQVVNITQALINWIKRKCLKWIY